MKTRKLGRTAIGAGAAVAIALSLLLAVTAPAAPPTLTLTATDAVIGGSISATAELSESPAATGAITFEVFGPDDPTCSGAALDESQAPVSGEGQYVSADFNPASAGLYHWSAHYSGDESNPAAESICSAISTVDKAAPGITASASNGTVGGTIDDEATVSGGFSPSGEVTFTVYAPGDTSCSTALSTTSSPLSSGEASSPSFSPQQAGEFRWRASYQGDANNKAASTACGAVGQSSAVAKASPGLSGTATSAVVGSAIHDKATVSGGFSPSGEVTFTVYAPGDTSCSTALSTTSAPLSSGSATSPDFFPQQAGEFRWRASYPGDANNDGASTPCGAANQGSAVGKTSPSLSGTATSGVVGGAVSDSVTLSGGFSPSGEVTFTVYAPGDTSCSTALSTTSSPLSSGSASSPSFSPQQAGEFRWRASYPGDANNKAASTACGAVGQSSAVAKASPGLSGTATSGTVGQTISDEVNLSGGFAPGGNLVFRAYGPDDTTCANPAKYEATVAVNGNGSYSPAGFAPGPGLYRWTVDYAGDSDNEVASLGCGAANQSSAVGTIPVSLAVSATGGTIGDAISATATIAQGAIPAGQLTFKAFPPSDANCTGAASFSSVIDVAGNGSYKSPLFAPSRVGSFRWTVAYSGDQNHAPATAGCGKATSTIAQATPSIAGAVVQQVSIGASFRDTATLRGGFAPGGTVTFRIYGPVESGCAKPAFVNIVAVNGNGTINSDLFVPEKPGRYSFVASYSGDAANQATSEPCDSPTQVVQVLKRAPKVKPRALLIGKRQISIRARLSGSADPSGSITFRLYAPGDKRCARKPAFSGGVTVKSNGTFPLARYLATKRGLYRLSVGYTGDQRNRRYPASCTGAQPIRVK